MAAHDYRVRIHAVGTLTPTDASAEWTFGLSHLAEPPTLPGPTIDIVRGSVETNAWALRLADTGGAVTSAIGDPATGRLWLLGRLCEVQRNVDGAGWVTIGTGRVADLSEPTRGDFTLRVEDERWVERSAEVFTTAPTTRLYPTGINGDWRLSPPESLAAITQVASSDEFVRLKVENLQPVHHKLLDWLREDLAAGDGTITGRFKHLRLRVGATDYPVVSFSSRTPIDSALYGLDDWAEAITLYTKRDPEKIPPRLQLWVYAPGGVVLDPSGFTYGYLHAPGTRPSSLCPLHTGVSGHPYGSTQPFSLLRGLYDEAGVRYDPAIFDALELADVAHVAFRITEPQNLADWALEKIYQPLGFAPFVDAQGRIAPRRISIPQMSDAEYAALPEFDASNVAPEPGWFTSARERITKVIVKYDLHRFFRYTWDTEVPPDASALDGVTVEKKSFERDWDQAGDAPQARPLTVDMSGLRPGGEYGDPAQLTTQRLWALLATEAVRFSVNIFEQFGDGPLRITLPALADALDVQQGDVIRVNFGATKLPNPASQTRENTRIMRVLSTTRLPEGVDLDVLDMGAAVQPLNAPTVAVVLGSNPDEIDVTVSGLAAGTYAHVQVALDAAFTNTRATHDNFSGGLWTAVNMPPGSTPRVRAYAHAPNRLRSDWSNVASVTMPGTPRVSGVFGAVAERTGAAEVFWTRDSYALGARVYAIVHDPDESPEPLEYQDVDASLGVLAYPIGTVPRGKVMTVEVEPWSGFSAGAVSGTAGPRGRALLRRGGRDPYRVRFSSEVDPAARETANLSILVAGSPDLFPVTAEIYDERPDDTSAELRRLTHEFTASGQEIGPATHPEELSGIPLSGLQSTHWWLKLTGPDGLDYWYPSQVTTAADTNSLRDVRVKTRTATSITFQWERGPLVDSVWVYETLIQEPAEHQWPGPDATPQEVLGAGIDEYTVTLPPPGHRLDLQLTPRDAAGSPGRSWRMPIEALEDQDEIVELSADVNDADGSVAIVVLTKSLAASWRYAFTVGDPPPAEPTDAVVEAGTIRALTNGRDAITLPAGTVSPGETFILRAAAYTKAGGVGTLGATDHGEIKRASDRRRRDAPHFSLLNAVPGAALNTNDLYIGIAEYRAGAGGTLHVWSNKAGATSPDPEIDPPDASVAVASTPFSATPATHAALDEVRVDQNRDKSAFVEFIAADGNTTGIHAVKLAHLFDLFTASGDLVSGAVKDAAQFAESLRPPSLVAAEANLGAGTYTGELKYAQAEGTFWRWDGTAWAAHTAPGVVYAAGIAAASIVGTYIQGEAIVGAHIAAGTITAGKMNIGVLSELSDDAGIIVSGKLQDATGTRFIDLDATTTQAFIQHPALQLLANGDATFGGTVSAGAVVAATLFTAPLAEFSGELAVGTQAGDHVQVGVDYVSLFDAGVEIGRLSVTAAGLVVEGNPKLVLTGVQDLSISSLLTLPSGVS